MQVNDDDHDNHTHTHTHAFWFGIQKAYGPLQPSLIKKATGSSYLPNPSARAGYDTKSIFKRSLTGLDSKFSFS